MLGMCFIPPITVFCYSQHRCYPPEPPPSQYETGRFSPYGDELYPLLKFLAESGHMDGVKWLKV